MSRSHEVASPYAIERAASPRSFEYDVVDTRDGHVFKECVNYAHAVQVTDSANYWHRSGQAVGGTEYHA